MRGFGLYPWWAFCVSATALLEDESSNNVENKKRFYKRWWFWVLVVIVLFIIIGSSGSSTTPTKVENGTQTAAQEQQQVYKVGDSIKLGKSIVTVNKVSFSSGSQYIKPSAGNEWINVNVTIENTNSSQQYVTTMGQMFVKDGNGNSYQVASTDKSIEDINNRLDGAIIANSKRTGWVGFEIPKGATGLQFVYNGSIWGGGNITVDLGR